MTDSWEDAVPAAPLAAVSLQDAAPAPAAAATADEDDWFADQRRNTDKAEKRERKAGAPKILKRVSSKGELPTKPQRRSPTQTDAEREQAYAAARARIFAEEAAAPAPSKKKGGADWASAALSAAARTPSSEDLRAAAPAPAPGPDPDVARGPSGAGFDPKARERTRENARRGPQPRQQRRPSHRRVTEDDGDPDYRRNNQPTSSGDGYGVYDGRPGYASTREEYYARPPPQYGAQPPPPQYGAQPDAYAYPPPQQIARGPPQQQNIAFGGYGFQPPPQMPEDYGARAFGGGAGFAPYTPAPPITPQEPAFRPPPPPPQFRSSSTAAASPALAPPEAGGNPHGLMTLGDFSTKVAAPAPAPSKNSGRGRGRRARGRGRGRTKGTGKPKSYEIEFPTL